MLAVDLIAACLLVGAAIWGYWAGFARVLPAVGFAAGAIAGALAAPLLLNNGQDSGWALVFAIPAALILGALVAAFVERWTLPLRRRLRQIGLGSALGGAFVTTCSALVGVWLLGAAFAQVSSLRDRIEGSELVGNLNEVLPPPGPAGEKRVRPFDPFPVVAGPRPKIAAPDRSLVDDPQVKLADESIVKLSVLRTCGRSVSGSGWFAEPGLVVTNAHVVSASSIVSVEEQGFAEGRSGVVVHFDPANDLAIVRVPDLLRVRPLRMASRPRPSTPGAVLGFPGGKHRIRAIRIGETSDSYRGRTDGGLPPEFPRLLPGRELTAFRGVTGPGGSGGPLVDGQGRVLGTVALGSPGGDGGYAVSNRNVRSALRRVGPAASAVSTGDCGPTSNSDERQ